MDGKARFFIAVGLLGTLVAFSVLRKSEYSGAKILKRERSFRILLQSAEALQRRYERGDEEGLIQKGLLKCPDIPKSSLIHQENYLKCNPHYLNCFLGSGSKNLQNKFPVHFEGKDYMTRVNPVAQGRPPQKKRYYRVVSRAVFPGQKVPPYAIELSLSIENEKGPALHVLLEDTCGDAYLPKRTYVYREHSFSKSKEHIWDNFNRDIYIDKNLVTFRDIIDWLELRPVKDISIPSNPAHWSLPASGLSPGQMELFCHFRGKQVVDALVYDAGSFFPTDLKKADYIDRQFPPFPWSRRKIGHKLSKIQSGKVPFDKSICSDIWTLECRQKFKTLQGPSFQRSSWMGMKELLGGHPEYLQNSMNPHYNVRPSSFYLRADSPLHRLGKRVHWTKKGFQIKNFTLEDQVIFQEEDVSRESKKESDDENQNIKVGFRCMFERRQKS
ncbi:MAG: hypothetical protein OXB88_01440 [Bacteriovoracales bacterium]|nr:hypothetical protein [Bacteriovoracales bacterium]